MMSREAFLDRVRTAAVAGRAYRIHPQGDVTERTGYVGAGHDPLLHFAREVDLVGGFARVVPNMDAAREVVASLCRRYEARSAICWQHATLDRLELPRLLAELHIERWDYSRLAEADPATQRERFLAANIGITGVDFAIAETGTLVVRARPGQERLASLLPPVHVTVVERGQILPDLFDLFARLQTNVDNLPSNVTLITGPSKTGDIELQLTTGVHGPGHWHVVVVNSE